MNNPDLKNLLVDPSFAKKLVEHQAAWRKARPTLTVYINPDLKNLLADPSFAQKRGAPGCLAPGAAPRRVSHTKPALWYGG